MPKIYIGTLTLPVVVASELPWKRHSLVTLNGFPDKAASYWEGRTRPLSNFNVNRPNDRNSTIPGWGSLTADDTVYACCFAYPKLNDETTLKAIGEQVVDGSPWEQSIEINGHAGSGVVGDAMAALLSAETEFRAMFAESHPVPRSVIDTYVAPDKSLSYDVPLEFLERAEGAASTRITTVGAAGGRLLWDAIQTAILKMGQREAITPTSDPSVEVSPLNENYVRAYRTSEFKYSKQVVVAVWSLPLVCDTVSKRISVHDDLSNEGIQGPFADAVRAQNEYNRSLQKAIASKSEGGPFVHPGPRPDATTADGLTAWERAEMDRWWENVSTIAAAADRATGPSQQTAYDNYVAGGGTATFDDWLAGRDTRLNAALGGSSPNRPDWMDTLGNGLGWAADKTGDALLWLGNSTLDLLKSWGPGGTVGAYAGVKAVDAVGSDSWFSKYWPLLAVGGAVLLLTRE